MTAPFPPGPFPEAGTAMNGLHGPVEPVVSMFWTWPNAFKQPRRTPVLRLVIVMFPVPLIALAFAKVVTKAKVVRLERRLRREGILTLFIRLGGSIV